MAGLIWATAREFGPISACTLPRPAATVAFILLLDHHGEPSLPVYLDCMLLSIVSLCFILSTRDMMATDN